MSVSLAQLRQENDSLTSVYGARFAGQSRPTRNLAEIDALVERQRNVVAQLQAAADDPDAAALAEAARQNLRLYETEREAIFAVKAGPPETHQLAEQGTAANFVFARFRRHFAGRARATRDLGLLSEMIDDLARIEARMKLLVAELNDPSLQRELTVVNDTLRAYQLERQEILRSLGAAPPDGQASILAEVANGQFQLYRDHFANRSRFTRRPGLLQRILGNLNQVKRQMEALQEQGLTSGENAKNIEIVAQNIDLYAQEVNEIRKLRAGQSIADLIAKLDQEGRDVMKEYQASFAGKDRSACDPTLMSKLCDELGELARQMADLGRAVLGEVEIQNLAALVDDVVLLEREYALVTAAKHSSG